MKTEKTFPAKIENMPAMTDFLTSHLEKAGIPLKQIYTVNIAADEIFSNIVKYAYPADGAGKVVVLLETDTEGVRVTFTDTGVPFDPLEMQEPDTTKSAEEREIGGLGILMVKKLMDEVKYRYDNGKNIVSVFKKSVRDGV